MPKKKLTLDKWKKYMGIIITTFAVFGIIGSQIGTGYSWFHLDDVERLEKMIVSSNQLNSKERELNKIQYSRDSISQQIFDLERREDSIWARNPLTDRDQVILKKIKRAIRKLEKRLAEIKARERELLK